MLSYVVNEEIKDGNHYLRALFWANLGGTPQENQATEFTSIIITIDNEDMSYETYGETPSPKIPSPIQNLSGDIETTICNQNLANADKIYERMQEHNSSQCSEVIEEGRECIRLNNTKYRPYVEN